jgi:hypothetical protein
VVEGADSKQQHSPGHAEPGNDLIHRSIAQVEHLLHRLEIETGAPAPDPNGLPRGGVAAAAAALSGEAQPRAATIAAPQEQAGLAAAMEQAEALRVVLDAHDEAERNRAEAVRLRAQAVEVADQLLSQADAARTALMTAQDAASKLRRDALDEAERIIETARRRAAEQHADAEARARARLEAAERDADLVRQAAWRLAQAEADRRAGDNERAAGDAETLASARQDLEQASMRLEQLSEDVKSKLASITSATGRLDTLLRSAASVPAAANGHAPGRLVPARVPANGTPHVRANGAQEAAPSGARQLEYTGLPADHGNGHGGANGNGNGGGASNGDQRTRRPLGAFFRGERQ